MKRLLPLMLILALLALASVACGGDEGDVPDPDYPEPEAPDEALPAPDVSGNVDGRFFVGGDACSDSGPGSEAQPFCTFEVAVSVLGPGATLEIMPGTYTSRLIIGDLFGTEDEPITIQSRGEGVIFDGGCPEFPCAIDDAHWDAAWDFDGFISIADSSHIILRDLTVQNVLAYGVYVWNGDHIVLEDLTIDGSGSAGLIVEQSSNVTVRNNEVLNAAAGYALEDRQPLVGEHEALSIVAVDGFEVAYNHVHDTLKEGIDIKELSTGGNVHSNLIERACAVGLYVNEAEDVDVYSNQVTDSGYRLDGGQLRPCDSHPVYGAWFGRWYGNGMQLAVGDLGDNAVGRLGRVRLYQNTIVRSYNNGVEFWDELVESGMGEGEMIDNAVYNNTIVDSGLAAIRIQDAENTLVTNNILAGYVEDALTGNGLDTAEISHNLFFDGDDDRTWGEPALFADPRFADPATSDFTLQPGSPAIDAGRDMGLEAVGPPDIGAHEFGGDQSDSSDNAEGASTGPLARVETWFYMIDVNLDDAMLAQMVMSDYDLIVLDYIPSETENRDFPMLEVTSALHEAPRPKLVLAYIDIGQAESYRTYWQDGWSVGNPVWIAGDDPDGWAENYPVAYWYDEWQAIWLGDNGYINGLIDAGFDGVYLDWVEAYSDENVLEIAEADGVDARQEMIWFIDDLAALGRSRNPSFIVIAQNAAELATEPGYLDIIDAIAQEQVWFDGGADNIPPGDCPLPATDADIDSEAYVDSLSPDCRSQWADYPDSTLHVSSAEYLQMLTYAHSRGEPIFTVDYALDPANVDQVYATSRSYGFIPFVSNRGLNQFVPARQP